MVKTCEGVFPAFRSDKELKGILKLYGTYCSAPADADYKLDYFGPYHQLYHSTCDGTGGVLRVRKSGFRACNDCNQLRGARAAKIKQTLKTRGENIAGATNALKRGELAESDYKDMKDFLKAGDTFFSSKG